MSVVNNDLRTVARCAAPILASITASVGAQSVTTDLITEADLASVRALVAECLQETLAPVADYGAQRSGNSEILHVRFAPHDGNSHYSAGLTRSLGEAWRLNTFALVHPFAEVANAGPVMLSGVFAPGVADAIAATVLDKWTTAFPELELRLVNIGSSLASTASCAALEPPTSLFYNVTALGRSARSADGDAVTPYPVNFRLVPGDGGALGVADAQWRGDFAALDGSMRQRLRALIDVPTQSAEERALAAALAAVPAPFAHARVQRSNYAVQGDGRVETIQVQLDEIDATPKRRVSSGVQCVKELEIDADWRCQHRLLAATQTVSGQLQPVTFPLVNPAVDFSEEFVERLVVEIREQLPRFLAPGEAQQAVAVLQLMAIEGRIRAHATIGGQEADVSIRNDAGAIRVVSLTRR
jgi:hypothetical protein